MLRIYANTSDFNVYLKVIDRINRAFMRIVSDSGAQFAADFWSTAARLYFNVGRPHIIGVQCLSLDRIQMTASAMLKRSI